MSRSRSFLVVVQTYAAAAAVAVAVITLASWHPVWEIVGSFVAATAVCFVVIRITANGSVFDAYWSVIPPVAGVALALGADGADGARQVVLLVLFGLWGLRLTYNWAMGWPGLHHEDWRYVMYKDKGVMPRWAVDAMWAMFVFASIPMLDERSVERRPGYADHMAAVPALLPRLRRG